MRLPGACEELRWRLDIGRLHGRDHASCPFACPQVVLIGRGLERGGDVSVPVLLVRGDLPPSAGPRQRAGGHDADRVLVAGPHDEGERAHTSGDDDNAVQTEGTPLGRCLDDVTPGEQAEGMSEGGDVAAVYVANVAGEARHLRARGGIRNRGIEWIAWWFAGNAAKPHDESRIRCDSARPRAETEPSLVNVHDSGQPNCI
jgi:hypothetical protein